MATEYSTRAFPVEPQPAREIAIGVEILRAIDGGDPDLASSFVMRFAPALDDASIAAAISARVNVEIFMHYRYGILRGSD